MIKVVAFDMDGTFLNSQNDYDRERFDRNFKALRERGIEVVAISGNQYYQIKSFFEGYLQDMTIAAEGGTQIYERGKRIKYDAYEEELIDQVIQLIEDKGLSHCAALAGLDSVYYLESADPDFKKTISKYSYVHRSIPSWGDRPEDPISQVTLNLGKEDVLPLVATFNEHGQGKIRAVPSGNGFIDLTLANVSKGTAMAYLGHRWGVSPEEMMAFGDSGNDLEMLELVGASYAMKGSPTYVYQAAKFEAPSNDESGVLVVIEKEILN